MKLKYIILPILFLSLFGCTKTDSNYVTEEEIEVWQEENKPKPNHCAYILDNDVYYINKFINGPIRLTNSPSELKTDVQLSYNKDKIVYLNADRVPIIISTQGELIKKLTQFNDVVKLNWFNEDKTLYMLIDDKIEYYGEELEVQLPSFPNYFGRESEISDISISDNLDLAYIHKIYSYYGSLEYDSLNVIYYSNGFQYKHRNYYEYSEEFNYINFTKNSNDLLIGYSTDNEYNIINKLMYYNGSDDFRNVSSDVHMITPVYNSEIQFFVCGTIDESVSRIYGTTANIDSYSSYGVEYEELYIVSPNSTNLNSVDWKW